jgi:N-methylhydantoinase A
MRRLGTELGLSADEAAEGVIRVVNAGMERAIRRISVERGHDPRRYVLVAFGGAAGMHACELAMGLGMRRVLVPFQPGLLSAWGAAGADLQRDYVRTVRLADPRWTELARLLQPLQARARRELAAEGAPAGRVAVASLLDVRYRGQSYEIQVAAGTGYRRAFHAAHRRLYGHADPERALEVVSLRVMGRGRGPALRHRALPPTASRAEKHRLRWNGRWLAASRVERTASGRGRVRGPLVITEFSATTFVPPGWSARTTPTGDLLLDWSSPSPSNSRRSSLTAR